MKFTSFAVVSALVAAASAQTTHTVIVGENQGLTYNPTSVTAAAGDIIAFQFVAKNHTVTQSTFAAPCTKSGVDSGFFPVQANASVVPQWSFTLNNASEPLWFYCAQTGHCSKGMVFAVNPTADKSFAAFQAAANGTATGSAAPSPSASAGAGGDANAAPSQFSFSSAASAVAAAAVILGSLL